MSDEKREPLVPREVDLSRLDGFMLDTVRLLGSELVALSTGDEFKAAVLLWCRAWKQRPACSLPDDDRVLASFAGYGKDMKGWRAVKDMALRGFILCADGRLYHQVLAEDAMRAHRAHQQRVDAIAKRWGKDGSSEGTGGNTKRQSGRTTKAHSGGNSDGGTDSNTDSDTDDHTTVGSPVIPTVARDGTGRDGTGKKEANLPASSPATACEPTGGSAPPVVSRETPEPDRVPLERCYDAAGIDWRREASPGWHKAQRAEFDRWLAAGYNLEETILPTIRAKRGSASEPIRSLKYFAEALAREHAKRAAEPPKWERIWQQAVGQVMSPGPRKDLSRAEAEFRATGVWHDAASASYERPPLEADFGLEDANAAYRAALERPNGAGFDEIRDLPPALDRRAQPAPILGQEEPVSGRAGS